MASNRQGTTYGDLAERMGYLREKRASLGSLLNPVMRYCQRNGLPPLTVLVVSEDTGLPGGGFVAGSGDLDRDRSEVFKFDWFSIFPPTLDELG